MESENRDQSGREPPPQPQPEGQAPVIRSAGITLAGSALGGALVILAEFLAARLLQVQAYGFYASGKAVASIGEAVSVFGMPVAIFHFIPAYRQKAQTEHVIGTVYAAALLPLVVGAAFAIAAWFLAPWLALNLFHDAQVVDFIRLLAFAVPFMAGSEILGAITRGFGHAKYYVIVKNLTPPLVFLSALGAMAHFRAQAIWIAGAVAAASLLACAVGIVAIVRIAGPALWRTSPKYGFRALYGYAAGIMANSVFYIVFALTGLFAVAFFLGSEAVGIYRFCLQIVLPLDMILLAFHAAMGPIYPILSRENRIAELEEAYGTAIRWMVMLQLPIGIAIAWNRGDLLALAGPAFASGAQALMIMSVGYSLCTCFGTIAYILMLSGRRTVETWNAALTTTSNIVLAIVLIPRFGLAGAAAAATFSFILLNVARILEARHLMGLRTFRPYFLRIIAISAGSGTATFYGLELAGIAQGGDVFSVALRIAAALAVHAAALWTLGLNAQDKGVLGSLLRSLAQRGAARGKRP